MDAKLIRNFKNHPAGMTLKNVSHGVYNMLLEGDYISDPRPLYFTPDVVKAATTIKWPKTSSRKEPKEK